MGLLTGVGPPAIRRAVLVASGAGLLSLVLWDTFARPSRYLADTLGLGPLAGSIALGSVLFVARRPLTRVFTWIAGRLPVPTRFVVAPLVAMGFFGVSWAGSHATRAQEIGLLPQAAFPLTIALFAYLVAAHGIAVQRGLRPFFRARDRVAGPIRFLLLTALTTWLASVIGRALEGQRALDEQLLVIAGLVLGYLLMAPRVAAAAVFVIAILGAGATPAAAATPVCPQTMGTFQLVPGSGAVTAAGAAGSFKVTCAYAQPEKSFDPLQGLAGGRLATGPILAAYWREKPGSDANSVLECRGGGFDPPSGLFTGSKILGSGTRRAFVVETPLSTGGQAYQTNLSDLLANADAQKKVSAQLLAAAESVGISCTTAPATPTPSPTLVAAKGTGEFDMTASGTLNGRFGPPTSFTCGSHPIGNDLWQRVDVDTTLDGTKYHFVVDTPTIGVTTYPRTYKEAPAQVSITSAQGAKVLFWEADAANVPGKLTLNGDLSGSVDLTIAASGADTPKGQAIRLVGSWRCGTVAARPSPTLGVVGGIGGGDEDSGGGELDLSGLERSLVEAGFDPDQARDLVAGIEDNATPLTNAIITLITAFTLGGTILAGGVPVGAGTSGGVAGRLGGASDVWDPYERRRLVVWEPGKYGAGADGRAGEAGDVWFGGSWVKPDRARREIQASLDADKRRERESEEFARGTAEERERWFGARDRERAEAEADRQKQEQARIALRNVTDITIARGLKYDDIYDRLDHAYQPDGRIDAAYVDKLRGILRDRLGRDRIAPDEELRKGPDYLQATKDTFTQAMDNQLIRMGTNFLTAGGSQVLFSAYDYGKLAASTYDAMQRSYDEAADNGRSWGYTDAIRAGVKHNVVSRLPHQTYDLYERQLDPTKPAATTGEIFRAIGSDVFDAWGTAKGLQQQYAQFREGLRPPRGPLPLIKSDGRDLTLKPPDPTTLPGLHGNAPARWHLPEAAPDPRPGAATVPPTAAPSAAGRADTLPGHLRHEALVVRDAPPKLRGLPEGSPIAAHDLGMSATAGRLNRQFVNDHPGLEIGYRGTGQGALRRLAQGDAYKPADDHAKTVNPIDVELGAPAQHLDRSAWFKPIPEQDMQKLLVGRSPEEIVAIQERWRQRMREYHDLAPEMGQKIANGRFALDRAGFAPGTAGGVIVHGPTAGTDHPTYFTGDNDILFYRYRDPATGQYAPVPRAWIDEHQQLMRPYGVQHEDQYSFRWARDGSAHDLNNRDIQYAIIKGHQPAAPVTPEMSRIDAARAGGGNPVGVFRANDVVRAEYAHPGDAIATPPEAPVARGLESWRKDQLRG